MRDSSASSLSFFNRREAWFIGGLIAVSFAIRAVHPGLMEFKHDEAVTWIRVSALVSGTEFSSTGLVSSIGVANCPLFLYIIAILKILLRHPEKLILPIALLNSVAIWLAFRAIRIIYDRKTAWLTALFYAFSPCAVFFSRKIWAQDLMPFWILVMFHSAAVLARSENLSTTRRAVHSFLLAVFLVTSPQIHLSALFLFPVYGIWLFLWRRKLHFRFFLCGVLVGAIPAIPYFIYLAAELYTGQGISLNHSVSAWHLHLKDMVNFLVRQPADETFSGHLGNEYFAFLRSLPGYSALRYLLSGLVALGVLLAMHGAISRASVSRSADRSMVFLLVVPWVLLMVTGVRPIPAYFIIFYPLPFLCVAISFARGHDFLSRRVRPVLSFVLVAALIFLFLAYNVAYTTLFLHKVRREGGTKGEYGPTYATTYVAAEEILTSGTDPASLSEVQLPLLAVIFDIKNSWRLSSKESLMESEEMRLLSGDPKLAHQSIGEPLTPSQRAEAVRTRTLVLKLIGE